MSNLSRSDRQRLRFWLAAAVVVAVLVRLPGVAWGVNWPDGFTSHHPDESTHVRNADNIISPLQPPRDGPAYPKAMGAYAAAPYLLWYAVHGHFGGPRVHLPWTVGAGRLVSVGFGVAAVLLVFAIGRDALRDWRAGMAGAWLMALGGLHVTQSHFFLADVPVTTWTLLSAWLLWRDLEMDAPHRHEALRWAAFAAGAAFAFKLFVLTIPTLVYAILVKPSRAHRATQAAVFLVAGLAVSSLGFETPASLYQAMTAGVNGPVEFSRLQSALFYVIELPSVLSLPLLLLGLAGTAGLVLRLRTAAPAVRRHALAAFGLPPVIGLMFVLFKFDHFARHLLFLIPWAAIAGGWCLTRVIERVRRRGLRPAWIVVPVFVWMAAFVVDGERFFIDEPRNGAALWLRANVADGSSVFWTWHRAPAGYRSVQWPLRGDPDVLVIEMFEANGYLSGTGWRNSFPTDPRQVFDGRSAERVAAVQALFRGTSNYDLAARFPDAYVMPEYRVAMTLLGDRSRSYITEVVIFRRRAMPPAPAGGL